MRRRTFITLVGCAAAWPIAARAQQRAKVPLLGYLTGDSDSADSPRRNAFREGLHKLGYNEGQTILIEYRTAAGSVEKLSTFAAEFSRLNVDVVFAFTAGATQAAAKAMPTKPIVSITPDPVLAGFVASLAPPAGILQGFLRLPARRSTANIWSSSRMQSPISLALRFFRIQPLVPVRLRSKQWRQRPRIRIIASNRRSAQPRRTRSSCCGGDHGAR